MAFCPHCGKGVTEQATACPACGQSTGAKVKGARFKGTMMTVGGQLQPAAPGKAVTAPPPSAGPASKHPIAPAAPAPPPQAVSTRNKGTMMGVGLPTRDPQPAPPSSATRSAKSPLPPPATTSAPRPKPIAPSAEAIVRRPAASENRALPNAASAANETAARRREGRFVAGSVPPPLVKQGSNRWVAIGLGGMALIATAGYLVAQFLGLIH
jgi:hypothetical protein